MRGLWAILLFAASPMTSSLHAQAVFPLADFSEASRDESPQAPWRCSGCGEDNEGQFGACWNCGAAIAG